jgi:hypothetical protein
LEIPPILIYGFLIFLGTEVIWFAYGFIVKFQETRGVPLSRRAQYWLEVLANALECLIVIWLIFRLSKTELGERYFVAIAALGVAVLIAYPLDVLWGKLSLRHFGVRALFAAAICVPLGIYLAASTSP